MKRSVQEIVELVVFGAIALLIGTGLLWVGGWVFSGLGWLFQAVSGLLWRLLIVLVPLIVVGGLIYWLATNLRSKSPTATVAEPAEGAAEPEGDAVAEVAAEPAAEEAVAEVASEPAPESVAEAPAAADSPAATEESQASTDESAAPATPLADLGASPAVDDSPLAEAEEPTPPPADEDRPLRNG